MRNVTLGVLGGWLFGLAAKYSLDTLTGRALMLIGICLVAVAWRELL